MNLEIPKKFRPLVNQARAGGRAGVPPHLPQVRPGRAPIRKSSTCSPRILDGMNDGVGDGGTGAGKLSQTGGNGADGIRNGTNMKTVLGLTELCWGDVGLALSIPRQGLGNAAIAAVANEEQLARFEGQWAAMAITEPGAGSDTAAIRTTADAGWRSLRPQW